MFSLLVMISKQERAKLVTPGNLATCQLILAYLPVANNNIEIVCHYHCLNANVYTVRSQVTS
jgi:hypothetical protein